MVVGKCFVFLMELEREGPHGFFVEFEFLEWV